MKKIDYLIESAPYGFLFTSVKTLEANEFAHSFVSKVLQRVNEIRTKHFLWCNLFLTYIRPISCNKPSKYNSVFFIFYTVKYRIIFHRFIVWNWPSIYNKWSFCQSEALSLLHFFWKSDLTQDFWIRFFRGLSSVK